MVRSTSIRARIMGMRRGCCTVSKWRSTCCTRNRLQILQGERSRWAVRGPEWSRLEGKNVQKGDVSIVTDGNTFTWWLVLRQVLDFPIHDKMATTSTLTTVRTIDSAQGHSRTRKLTELIGHKGRGHQRDRPSLSAIAPLLAA